MALAARMTPFQAAIAFTTGAVVFGSVASAQSSRSGWGSTPYSGGTTFRVWAPHATSVYVAGTFNSWSTTATALAQEKTNGAPDGVWSADVAGVTTNAQYKYYINNGGGYWKHDPQSRWVTQAGSASGANDIVYSTTNFNWGSDAPVPLALSNMFIYELHMGTFPASSSPSRFVAATNKLPYLKALGINAVEVMPIAEFGNTGSSWGYDPAQMFAVDNSQYGGPDAFKTFVRACHSSGIAVLLDTVHNHYGTGLLDMWNFDGWAGTNSLGGGGIYFYETDTNLQITPWGATRPNFSSNYVCEFIESNVSMWLNEYHVDGFRWDAASAILYANDGSYIAAAGSLVNTINSNIHSNYPGRISIAEDVYNAFGFDSAWDTSYPGNFTAVLTNTADSNRNMNTIANDILYNVRYGGAAGFGRVTFLEDHDVVGDLNGGQRLVTAIDPSAPGSYYARKLSTLGAAVTACAPGVPMIFQGEEMLENHPFDSGTNVDWTKTNTYNYIVKYYGDLIAARRNLYGYTPGLEGSQCAVLKTDNVKKIIAFSRWNSGAASQFAFVVANFASNVVNNYNLTFPAAGSWYPQFNGDSTNYGPDYANTGSAVVTAAGNPPSGNVTVGPYSAIIFTQTPPVPSPVITRANNTLTISWPAQPAGWSLYESATLSGNPPPWAPVPRSQYQTNGPTISISVTSPGGAVFYQMQKP